jgi:glutaredoxin-related protein
MTNVVYVDDARARIVETIKLHPIVLFVKGRPSCPQCGFSAAVIQTLAHYGVPYHAVDVLADPPVRQSIETFSDWPTIPSSTLGRLHRGLQHRARNARARRTCGSTRHPSRRGCIMTDRTATRWAQAPAPSEAIFGGERSSDPAQSGRMTLHQVTGVPG